MELIHKSLFLFDLILVLVQTEVWVVIRLCKIYTRISLILKNMRLTKHKFYIPYALDFIASNGLVSQAISVVMGNCFGFECFFPGRSEMVASARGS